MKLRAIYNGGQNLSKTNKVNSQSVSGRAMGKTSLPSQIFKKFARADTVRPRSDFSKYARDKEGIANRPRKLEVLYKGKSEKSTRTRST